MLIERTKSRIEQVLEKIDQQSQVGLEIGALDKPIAHKSVGRVFYADYCSRDQLLQNHATNPSVDKEKLVEVDFITNGGLLSNVVPNELRFDYVIASHVIEHVPDIISWFQDIGNVIKPGGVLSLIIPNKERTFDIRRSLSEQKDFFAAYILKQTRPSPIQVFDFYRWHERDGRLVHSLEQSIQMASLSISQYVDSHCWVFTPESFANEIHLLIEADFIPFQLDVITTSYADEIDMFARLIRK